MILFLSLLNIMNFDITKGSRTMQDEFILMIDAGSSGTRFYLFEKTREEYFPISSTSSVYERDDGPLDAETAETAFAYIQPGLVKVSDAVLTKQDVVIDVYVYGTAGMRLVSESTQEDLYRGLSLGLQTYVDPIHQNIRWVIKEAKTISGNDEGFFAAIATNYLAHRITRRLDPGSTELYGALELGGSSTQWSFDVKERSRNRSVRKRRQSNRIALTPEDFFTHSYLNYGANRMRDRLVQLSLESQQSKMGPLMHPCFFKGDTVLIDQTRWTGEGNGTACIERIKSFVVSSNHACPNGAFCALDSIKQPRPSPQAKFYAFGVYYYATQFAANVIAFVGPQESNHPTLSMPNPSLRELQQTTEWICQLTIDRVDVDPSTSPRTPSYIAQLSRRCLDLSYIVVLMRHFGFHENDQRVFFVHDIDHHEVNWAMGAYLIVMAQEVMAVQESELYQSGLPTTWYLVCFLCVMALLFLYRKTHRRICTRLRYFRFFNYSRPLQSQL